jgi:hypothetical protein
LEGWVRVVGREKRRRRRDREDVEGNMVVCAPRGRSCSRQDRGCLSSTYM